MKKRIAMLLCISLIIAMLGACGKSGKTNNKSTKENLTSEQSGENDETESTSSENDLTEDDTAEKGSTENQTTENESTSNQPTSNQNTGNTSTNNQNTGNNNTTSNSTIKKSPVISGNSVTFYYVDENAKQVAISGFMNNWAENVYMTKKGSVFSYTYTSLEAGWYEYKFIVDGNWITDPLNPNKVNDGGTEINSAFTIAEAETQTQMTDEEYKMLQDKLNYENVPDMDIHRKKIQWVRENYGDTITCEDIVFIYDEATSDYVMRDYITKYHVMTSQSTSVVKYMFETRYRLPEYLGYYGTEHPLYNSVGALNYMANLYYEEITNAQEITENYLLQLGFTSEIPQDEKYKDFWSSQRVEGVEFWSPEGVPISFVDYDGFIQLYVSYPDNREALPYDFTIEEYNEFVATYTSFEVREFSYWESWMGGEYQERIQKYIYIY